MLRANRILKSGSLRIRYASMTSSSDISNEKPPLAETMGKPVGTVDGVKFEKINVTIPGKGLLDDVHCMVNKNISTGHDISLHVSPSLHKKAALGIVRPTSVAEYSLFSGGNTDQEIDHLVVDLNEPIAFNCELEILNFQMSNDTPDEYYDFVNTAYWRTCSLLLEETVRTSFTSSYDIEDIEYLNYKPSDGCFGIKFNLKSENDDETISKWTPVEHDLINFTKRARKVLQNQELVLRGKGEYQIGNSIQKLDGPCIRSLELIGQFSVTACSRIGDRTFIIQGVSMPKEFKTNHFLFGRLEQNAKNIPKHISAEANQTIQSNRILANVGKRKSYIYKQWTGEYDVEDVEEIDLSDQSEKISAELNQKMAEMESQPNHPKVKSARQHDLASKYYRQKMAFDFTNKQKINMFEMFKQPKFKNTVGETKHDHNLV